MPTALTQPKIRIKICGLTRPQDVQDAVRLGADAIGFVLYEKSPRAISAQQAATLCRLLPPFVTPVLLFVNAPPEQVQEALRLMPQALLQFHGDEPPDECQNYRHPYLKAARIPNDPLGALAFDLHQFCQTYASAQGILLDSLSPQFGGTGETFNWDGLPLLPTTHLVLGGGLNAQNVVHAISVVGPKGLTLAVDVSSGVESAKGIKDARKMAAFIQAVRPPPLNGCSLAQRPTI
jgi:phosphoribosylanthranilate isomerase